MSTNATIKEPERVWTLNASHQCDGCGARAYVQVSMPSGGELLFCRHHSEAVEAKLRPTSLEWLDETGQLTS